MFRIALFIGTNMAVLLLLGIIMNLFGLRVLENNGVDLNLTGLLVFSFVIGMSGSFISLFLSKWLAKRATGAKVIEHPCTETERWILDVVSRQSATAGIQMPEVAIFQSPEPNAFATGASRNKALVAVSTGLLQQMERGEVEAVLGHEIGHVTNNDMVTLALVQGVVNTFVVFFARIIGHFVDRVILKNASGHGIGYFVASIAAQIVLGILASTIVHWFSRRREFRADIAGARLASKDKMVAALSRLQALQNQPTGMPTSLAAFGIRQGKGSGWRQLFATHPPLEIRIATLQRASM